MNRLAHTMQSPGASLSLATPIATRDRVLSPGNNRQPAYPCCSPARSGRSSKAVPSFHRAGQLGGSPLISGNKCNKLQKCRSAEESRATSSPEIRCRPSSQPRGVPAPPSRALRRDPDLPALRRSPSRNTNGFYILHRVSIRFQPPGGVYVFRQLDWRGAARKTEWANGRPTSRLHTFHDPWEIEISPLSTWPQPGRA